MQETVVRNMPFCEEFIIVTNAAYEFIVEGQMRVFQGLKYRCVYEETARNTAAPISLLSMLSNPSELLYVVTADTIIEGSTYKESVLEAMELAKREHIVVFGIKADSPNVRFGYIHRDGQEVLEFREKPSYEEAYSYIENGDYLWNSGMFLMSAGDFVQELRMNDPKYYQQCCAAAARIDVSRADIVLTKDILEMLPEVSVEKKVFEHSIRMKVVEADYQWVDVDELEDVIPYFEKWGTKDVILQDCERVSVVNQTKKQLVVAQQLKDMMVINTEDALYIAPQGTASNQIKDIIRENRKKYGNYFHENRVVYRPWGNYEVINQGNGFKVKKATIYPGKTMYSHIHEYRSEHWSVVSGRAQITLDGRTKEYAVNESIYVPMGIAHQVSNYQEENLIIIEVSIGDNIVESDTIRAQDNVTELVTQADSISRLEPAFKDYLWGGTKLKGIYDKKCDYDIVAESWELSAHPAGQSVIAEGRYKGKLFGDYLKKIDKTALGWKCQAYEEFPILIKLIDAREKLSIQVHPQDEFALVKEGEYGKNEMWYILECEENASLYCGFKRDVTKEELLQAIEQEQLPELLQEVKVQRGDTVFIPAGTIHAIGAGILLCEIQQNSNSTYRIYDYGRTDKYGNTRELHLDKAMQVLDYSGKTQAVITRHEVVECNGYSKQLLGQCKYFECVKLEVKEEAQLMLEDSSFTAVHVIDGSGVIEVEDKSLTYTLGDTFFIPAGKRKLTIWGKGIFILTRV